MFKKKLLVYSAPDFSGMDFDYKSEFEKQINPNATYVTDYDFDCGHYDVYEIV